MITLPDDNERNKQRKRIISQTKKFIFLNCILDQVFKL